MKQIFNTLLIFLFITGCSNVETKPISAAQIEDPIQQENIFKNLLELTNQGIPTNVQKDSLAFLVLPLKLSCASCRKKTIDSIMQHEKKLLLHHYIILSSSDGIRNIESYFLEQNYKLPEIEDHLYIDSSHLAYKLELVKDNPAIYYTVNQKAYKKVFAIPATVKNDLQEFFSGYRQ